MRLLLRMALGRSALALGACAALILVESAGAASFFVRTDRDMVQQASAIVVASALASHTELSERGAVQTITTMSLEEVIKGPIGGDTFDVHEPGGVYGDRISTIPGVPQFKEGERYILFLLKDQAGLWHALDLVLGKFTFRTDLQGVQVALRDVREIRGWSPDGSPHHEQNRSAEKFLDFLRITVKGGPARDDYMVPPEPLVDETVFSALSRVLKPVSTFTPTSYTYDYSSSLGARWNIFPSSVTWFSTGTVSGAPGSGATAITTAMASWNNDPDSNVSLVYGGNDASGTHTGGVSTRDTQNTIAWERNLTGFGVPAFSCTSNSYSGTFGIAGVVNDSGTHAGPNSEMFHTSTEADVEMNQGISGCTFLFGTNDLNSAVTHEVGHGLGFRHSDQDRNFGSPGACSGPSLECSTSAIMKAFIPSGLNAALQTWDQNAVGAVYPVGSPPAAPTGVVATATGTTTVSVTWTTNGAPSYRVYRSSGGGVFALLSGTPAAPPYIDSTAAAGTAYLYRVTAFNGAESLPSNADLATTVIFTDTSLAGVVVKAAHVTQLRTAINAVRTLAGLGGGSYLETITALSTTVKASHITEMRSALNAARADPDINLPAVSFSRPTLTPAVTTIAAVDITELRGGVQ